jgi:hypothetical protein
MKAKDWLKKKTAMLALAMGNIEKNVLSQNGETLSSDVTQTRRHTQGQLMDSLVNGVITEEVQNLRWRMYKALEASKDYKTTILKDEDGNPLVDEDGNFVTKTRKVDRSKLLENVKLDTFDIYPLEMVIDNAEITLSVKEGMAQFSSEKPIQNKDLSGNTISATHGVITAKESTVIKPERPINIIRDSLSKFSIENFTEKLNIRKISETERLLEFYVSKYPDEYNRTSRLFISDIKKAINNPRQSSILDIKGVSFITYNTLGVNDFLEYEFNISSFSKIIEFGGHYVIKFIGEVTLNGKCIIEEHRMEELDKKYKNKEKRKK